jgi:hypothetical protein
VQRGNAFTARTKRVFEGFKDASTVVKTKATAVPEE